MACILTLHFINTKYLQKSFSRIIILAEKQRNNGDFKLLLPQFPSTSRCIIAFFLNFNNAAAFMVSKTTDLPSISHSIINSLIEFPKFYLRRSPPPPKERSWRNRCLLGLTCAIIGLDGGDFAVVADQDRAMAMDMQPSAFTNRAPTRWSDKRACLPWRINSLETIVPENLPRPSARRRLESTGFSERAAPPVKVAAKSEVNGCFNL